MEECNFSMQYPILDNNALIIRDQGIGNIIYALLVILINSFNYTCKLHSCGCLLLILSKLYQCSLDLPVASNLRCEEFIQYVILLSESQIHLWAYAQEFLILIKGNHIHKCLKFLKQFYFPIE